EFFKEIDNLKTEIAAVGASVQEIQSLHESALAAINNSQSRKFASQLGSLKTQTQQRNLDIRKRIQCNDGQIRQTQANALRKKFIGVIQEYQEMEQTFDQRYRQRIERQIRIVKPDATSDEVDDIIDSDRSNEVFTQSLMHAGRTSQAKAVLNEVQDRHQDIKRIEKTILELHQLFIDMSVLVEQQGETLKEVEQHAEDTSGNVEQGNRFISRAVKSAKATRRKKWWCVCICIILFIIIAILIWWFILNPLVSNIILYA
ncbi:t-SNARE, partial [Chlamydoabsidia padenii]